jgi:hypothetical protein
MGSPPKKSVAMPSDEEGGPAVLWERSMARVMQPAGAEPLERPTLEEAQYLYDVAIEINSSYSSAQYPSGN